MAPERKGTGIPIPFEALLTRLAAREGAMDRLPYDVAALVLEEIAAFGRPMDEDLSRPFEHLRPTPEASEALANLCAINHRWLSFARPYLLRSVRLNVLSNRAPAFDALLSPPEASHLREHVQILEIRGGGGPMTFASPGCYSAVLSSLPNLRTVFLNLYDDLFGWPLRWDILERLNHVERLVICHAEIMQSIGPARGEGWTGLAKCLATLEIQNSNRIDVDSLQWLLKESRISKLVLARPVDWTRMPSPTADGKLPPAPDMPVPLESLTLAGGVNSPTADPAAQFVVRLITAHASTLRTLSIGGIADRQVMQTVSELEFPVLEQLYLPEARRREIWHQQEDATDVTDSAAFQGDTLSFAMALSAPCLSLIGIPADRAVYDRILVEFAAGQLPTVRHVRASLWTAAKPADKAQHEAFRAELAPRGISFRLTRW